jgi:hypothetical protein
MNDSTATLDPVTISPWSSLKDPSEEGLEDRPFPMEARTTAPESLESETAKAESLESLIKEITEACKLAEGEPCGQFTNKFMQLINEAEFEFGFGTPADEYVREALDTYGTFAREWISHLYIENFHDPFMTCAILRVIAHLEYGQMCPQGMVMAAGVAAHKDASVRECGVRCFENWEHPDGLKILQHLSFSEDWLEDYRERVISDLQELTEHVVSR